MKFLFKYATRSRPKWFKDTLTRWINCLSGKHEALFVVSIDEDDESMVNPDMINWLNARSDKVTYSIRKTGTKIEAINGDVKGRDFDILVVVSDDMSPVFSGYDDTIARDMMTHFPQLDGALHYPDGQRGDLITLSIMGKKLYDKLGYVYYPGYISMWCDNEFTDVVKAMGKYKYLPTIIVRHEWMKDGADDLYKCNANKEWWAHDKALYEARKAEGFNG